MFVIIAALLLVSLLFRLSFERRAPQWGLLSALGWDHTRIQKLLNQEGLILAVSGACIGALLGIAYGYGVLVLLRTVWIGAVGVPFIEFHVGYLSLVIGTISGALTAWLTIWQATRIIRKSNAIDLLRNRLNGPAIVPQRLRRDGGS